MDKDIRLLGQLVELRGAVDRRVIVMLFRALLIDASREKLEVFADFLAMMRSGFEGTLRNSPDDGVSGHERVALMHFETWASELEQMLQEVRKGRAADDTAGSGQ